MMLGRSFLAHFVRIITILLASATILMKSILQKLKMGVLHQPADSSESMQPPMAAKTFIHEALAPSEKKMDMTLDDIIKMSKNNPAKPPKKLRNSNRSQKFTSNFAQDKSSRIRIVMDTKSALRQGALAQKRSNFQANSIPWATQAARKATVAPI